MGTENEKISTDVIHKELDLIQDVIKRMASNSFQVKGWLIGILSAIIVFEKDTLFFSGDGDRLIAIALNAILFLPILCFWRLDAFFLQTERNYRGIYSWVVRYRKNTDAYLYDLNTFEREYDGRTENLINPEDTIINIMFSKTLRYFYLIPLGFVLALIAFNLLKC
ncbi:hypothetical protein [Emticicia fontis]